MVVATMVVATMVFWVEIAVVSSSFFYFFAAAAVTASALAMVADASLNICVQKELIYSSFCFCDKQS